MHNLALAIGGCTVGELRNRMSSFEMRQWRRYFVITGPAGDRRLDENFAYLRQVVFSCHVEKPPTIDECRLKYDYKRCFPKDLETELEEIITNIDADIAKLESRFGKSKAGS